MTDLTIEELIKTLEQQVKEGKSKRIDKGYASLDVVIHIPSIVKVGEGTIVNSGCILNGPITIGKYSMIGFRTLLFANEHNFKPEKLICIQEASIKPIEIGDDVWIGAHVFVRGDIKIGNHAIVGAGAVVTHNIPEWEIWVGVPAKKIGDRRTWEGCKNDKNKS